MKTRNRLYDKSRLRLLCLLTALLGLFGAGHALAGNPTTLTVGGTDVLNGGYWTTNADGTLTPDGASADNYNVYYDGNGTLTLKDATINGTDIIGHVGAGIYAEGDLTIVLEGSSTVTGVQDPNDESQSIRVSGNLTIQGGSLTAQGAETSSGSSYGIFVTGSFTQQSGIVTAIGGNVNGNYSSEGLYVYGAAVTVQSGTLTATGGDTSGSSYGISARGSVTVGSAAVTATGGSGNASYGLYIDSSSPSVTLSGGSLTARSGSATSEAGGIYVWNPFGSAGAVTVGDNSTLLANSVILHDNSFNEKPLAPTGNGSWLIYGQSNQPSAVGGNYTLEENITIPEDVTLTIPTGSTLTIPAGVTLTVEGTLNNGGTLSIAAETCLTGSGSLGGNGSFTAAADAATEIVVPEGVTCANYQEMVVLGGPTVLGHAFAANADGWTFTFEKGACTLGGCTYTATVSKAGSEPIVETFTAHHSFDAEGKCPCGASLPQTDAQGRYQVADAFQLRWFAALVNGTLEGTALNAAACAVLTTNIDLTGADWTPIGNASTIYTGTFDGQNHTISGMTIENAESYSGLFGNVTGTVRDFTVTGSITGDETVSRVGGAVGSLGTASVGGTVSGVTSGVNITVSAGNDHIGGVVGSMPENSSPTVENCVYTGDINITVAAGSVAGVVGYIRTGTIQNCANQGGISINTGGNGSVGGILGYCNNGEIYIRNCYNSGSIAAEGTANVGAIVGQNNKTQATVSNCCYLTGSADKGQGQLTDDAAGTAVKTDEDFKSGAVAVLLQGSQTVQVWGQLLGRDDFPVLTTDEAKRVYAAKLYKGSAENVSELYKNASGISSPEGNALLVIENAPSASAGTNVVVKSGDAYTCANLVLTDGADFYTPVAFTATQATYSRPLAEGTQWGTVALPFDATSVTGAELFRVASQDGDALYVDETSRMADGEPLVFRANAEVTEVGFNGTNVAVRATDDEAGSTLLKGTSQTVSQLDAGTYFIYGDKFYRVASGSQVGMKPFRAYIPATAGASTRSAGAASQLRIIFNADK